MTPKQKSAVWFMSWSYLHYSWPCWYSGDWKNWTNFQSNYIPIQITAKIQERPRGPVGWFFGSSGGRGTRLSDPGLKQVQCKLSFLPNLGHYVNTDLFNLHHDLHRSVVSTEMDLTPQYNMVENLVLVWFIWQDLWRLLRRFSMILIKRTQCWHWFKRLLHFKNSNVKDP